MSTAVAKKSLKDCIRHFTPAWFAAIMGTGSISILFNNSPYARDSPVVEALVYIFFFLNLVLFVIFNALTIARYIMFPDIWSMMIHHPIQSLFVGAYPMGLSTLLNIAVGFLYQRKGFGGQGFLYAMWGVWWFDVALSVACAFELVHIMKTRHEHSLSRMTANWLLPVVTLIVISSTGGVLAEPLAALSPSHALLTLTVSLVLVSMGLGLAMMILTMYLLRLIVHGVPPSSSVLSVFIPLGPMGQGGYSILLLGQGFRAVLPLNYGASHVLREAHVADTIATLSLVVALVLWSLATMWMIYALLAVVEVLQQTRFPFKQAFWGLIFPNVSRLSLLPGVHCGRRRASNSHPPRVLPSVPFTPFEPAPRARVRELGVYVCGSTMTARANDACRNPPKNRACTRISRSSSTGPSTRASSACGARRTRSRRSRSGRRSSCAP
ncbi:voltage-dependent anion channel-domain-containing protein [Cubamyces menziesii]|nr:voltage-dependent anion channel-domain-containing protein [Cubamyces menziesii]